MSTVRIATVIATGHRYIVDRLELREGGNGKAHCWGELISCRGLNSKHEGRKVFLMSAVRIDTVEKTFTLESELFEQAMNANVEQGFQVRRTRGGNAVISGKKEQT